MEIKYIVYLTINLCNGKFYIGVHKTNPNVFDGYIGNGIYRENQAKGRNEPFCNAVLKYGYINFKRTTIKIFDNKEEAYLLESILVNETILRSKNCYNITKGGYGGNGSELLCKEVYQFNLKGKFIKKFKSISEAEQILNISHISDVLNSKRNTAGGFF